MRQIFSLSIFFLTGYAWKNLWTYQFISVDIYILYILYILGKDEYKKTEICRCIDFSSNFKCSFAELKSADGA